MVLTAALAACGGGGGGGGGAIAPGQTAGNPQEVGFTSFAAVAPNQTVVMSGLSQGGSGTNTAFNLGGVSESNSAAKLTFDGNGELSGISVNSPQANLSFGAGQTGCTTAGACTGATTDAFAVVMNPVDLGWNYQSFGVWMNNVNSGTFQAGALSAGAVTPGSAVPTIGSATFTGHAGGLYFDGSGGRFATDAQMSAVTNFQNRTIQFSTTGTLLTDTTTFSQAPNAGLDLSGNLSYAAGASKFSGNLNTANGNLSGNATGRFYGPSAQEMGGVYGLSNSSGSRMVGGFGGKR